MDVEKAIKTRHSARSFKETKKADWRDVIKAIDAANYSPQAGNISTLRFILIMEPEKISKLTECCQQRFVRKSNYIVVVCSDMTQIKRAYKERADKYARQQAGAAIQNFLLEITNLNLGSCWVGEFDENGVKDALLIPEDIEIEALIPVGYEMGSIKERRNPKLDDVIYFHKWKNKFMKPKKMPDAR